MSNTHNKCISNVQLAHNSNTKGHALRSEVGKNYNHLLL